MKKVKKGLLYLLFFSISAASSNLAMAQKEPSAKAVTVKNLVDSQQYVFYAQSATPASGRQRFLTSEYTLAVSKDTVKADLPYFGRAYSAPINPGEGGIKFTAQQFDYNVTPTKKNGWNINIRPKGTPNSEQLMLSVFDNGTAWLQVTSANRQPISFNGYIRRKKA